MKADILVIGAGLSGLALARALVAGGRSVAVLEARGRVGGRIAAAETRGASFDMGPAWFWPGQERMERLASELGLARFEQHADGAFLVEHSDGTIRRGEGHSPMRGSWRLANGLGQLAGALADGLPPGSLCLGSPVERIARIDGGVRAAIPGGGTVSARRAVLALPPRLAAGIDFAPALGSPAMRAMGAVPTWMAAQAKAVAVYDRPFWRAAGLSGSAMSRRGPLAEIHDATPAEGGMGALFGFVGVPPEARHGEATLRAAILAQLERLFGPAAAAPIALHLKDWAFDPRTAAPEDRAALRAHPAYGPRPALRGLWDGRLIFSGSETASVAGGFLEGALAAAQDALEVLDGD